jgi:hypothetical protein
MGYPIPSNSLKVTVGTRTFAVAAWTWNIPIGGVSRKVGIYEQQPGGDWNEAAVFSVSTDVSPMLPKAQAAGGSVKYLAWLIAQINQWFATTFGTVAPAPVITIEPTTDDELIAYLASHINALRITVSNGVPVLS